MIDKEESHTRRKEIYARIAELRQKVAGSGRGAPAFDSAEVETVALISELQDLGNQELVHEHRVLSEQTSKLKSATSSENVLEILEEFGNLRKQCPAIKKILLPADAWESFHRMHLFLDEAAHESILLLAFDRGYLNRITAPIHKYLMVGNEPLSNLNKNYAADLKEQWMEQSNELDRHKPRSNRRTT